MKITSVLVGCWAAGMLSASAQTWTVTSGEGIPDYTGTNAVSDSGLLSTLQISGGDPQFAGNANPITAQINSIQLHIAGGWNGDYEVTLYHILADNSVESVVLLNRPGVDGTHPDGFGNAGMDVTLVAGQPAISGSYSDTTPVTGTYGLDSDGNYDAFVNSTPVGLWSLYITDNSSGDTGTLVSWTLNISVVPEPANLFGAGLLMLGGVCLWRRLQRA